MATTYYTYTKAVAPALEQLKEAIEDSSMSQTGKDDFEFANWKESADELKVRFANALITADETILDAIVLVLPNAPGAEGPLRGRFYKRASSWGLSTTTSNTWQTKVSLDTVWVEAGDYYARCVYGWYYTNVNDDFEARLLVDDTDVKFSHVQEPKDAGTDQRHPVMAFRILALTEGKHNIKLQYRSGNGSSDAGIAEAGIEFYEVPS